MGAENGRFWSVRRWLCRRGVSRPAPGPAHLSTTGYALRHGVLLVLPVTRDHAHVLRVGLAERRFVGYQYPSGGRAQALRLLLEQDRVGFESVQ